MAAVKSAEMRVRCKVITWQELAALLPEELQEFLDWKYGIVRPGRVASGLDDFAQAEYLGVSPEGPYKPEHYRY